MSDTVFTKVDYTLGALVHKIELGEIGLPDIQRPFVWTNSKVRDLHAEQVQALTLNQESGRTSWILSTTRNLRDEDQTKMLRLLPHCPRSRVLA